MTAGGAIRIAIIDDQQLFAEGLARIVEADSELHVVAIAAGPSDLPDVASGQAPHVVVLDYRLADDTGLAAVPAIKAAWPDARVLLVTGFASEHTRTQARVAGCHGFVGKDESPAAVLHAIKAIARDETVGLESADREGDVLTARELEVLALLGEGRSPAEIAQQLFIGVVTVRNHVQRILRKLDASTQLEAVIVGMRRGLVHPPQARDREDTEAR